MIALALALSIVGGICELAGVVLVVCEIARDRARAARLFQNRPRKLHRRRSYPGRTLPSLRSFPDPLLPRAAQQQAIVRRITQNEAATYNALLAIRKAVDAELDESVERVQQEIVTADDELRTHLRYVLAGSISDRIRGVILLVAGILFGTAGTVISTLAH